MSFLAPLFLAVGRGGRRAAAHSSDAARIGARIEIPAARYLARAESEHSRTLRIRNLLLMLLRVLALLAIAVAAARPVARWVGCGHAPTAMAIVIDNSLSSSRRDQRTSAARPVQVDGARRRIGARSTGDRLWLVTIDGRVRGGRPSTLRDEINRLDADRRGGGSAVALSRAASVVRGSGLEARQVALVTDGQRTEWQRTPAISNAQLLIYRRRSAAGQSGRDPCRGAAGAVDAARRNRSAVSLARFDDVSHYARWPHPRARHRGAE